MRWFTKDRIYRGDTMGKIRVGIVQVKVLQSFEENTKRAVDMAREAANRGCNLVVLSGVCMISPMSYQTYRSMDCSNFLKNLSDIAKEMGIFIIGSSVPEPAEDDKFYSSSYVFNDKGDVVGKYRQIHLLSTNTDRGKLLDEKKWIIPGEDTFVFDTPFGKIGLLQGFDIRFPRVCESLMDKGAKVIVFQGSFSIVTGEHAETLLKGRALDNQVFLISASQARNDDSFFLSYGRSMITDPRGRIVNQLDKYEGILIEEIDVELVDEMRFKYPILTNRRL